MATLQQIEQALRAADAAGNADDAKRLAQEYARMRSQQAPPADVPLGSVGAEAPMSMVAKPSLFRMDSDFREKSGVGMLPMLGAAARDMFGSREGAAEYLAGKAGGSVITDDAGDPLVKLGDGTRYRLNDPGIDSTDLANVAGNVAALWQPAAWAARLGQVKNLGPMARALLQGGTAATADTGLQAVANAGEVDPVRSLVSGIGGAGGELLGTGVAALANRAGAAYRSMGTQNTRDAYELLGREGVPATPKIADNVIQNMEQVRAGADPSAILGDAEYGFTYTLGQRLTDPAQKFQQLSREESLRQTPAGFSAFDTVRQNNASALDNALNKLGFRFGASGATTPAEMVQGSASGIRQQAEALDQQISDAYRKAGEGMRAAVGTDSIKMLPTRLRDSVRDFGIDAELTPASYRTLQQISSEAGGIAQAVEGGKVTGVTLKALETQRRIINNRIGSAANPTDRAAMSALKREFDGWLDEAVDSALITGDPSALQALKEARSLRAEFGRRFEGGADTDKFIAGLLDGSRTPEELMNVAMGASQVSKAGGARFIERLRVAANDDPGVMGGLRSAHLSRLTRGKDGEPLAMGQIIRNIKQTEFTNDSVIRALYGPDEWAEVRRLANALEPLVAKGDFAKSSGTGERMARMAANRFGGGVVMDVLQAVMGAAQGAKAQRAITAPVRKQVQAPAGLVPLGDAALQEAGR